MFTHPHAGLQSDLGYDGPEGDAALHTPLLGTDDLVWVGGLWEVCGTTLVRRQGDRCDVRTLRERRGAEVERQRLVFTFYFRAKDRQTHTLTHTHTNAESPQNP